VLARLRVRQIDAGALLEEARERYRAEIREIFGRLGLDRAAGMDRAVVESVWNLAPPGADEVMALVELTDAALEEDVLVVDAAPTGHFLRLLEMPELAGQWARALLRILARYRTVAGLDEPVARVLGFARQLRQLKATLADGDETGVFLVTLEPSLVRAETVRLRAALDAGGMRVAACIVNRADAAAARELRAVAGEAPLFAAPELPVAPLGAAGLTAFLDSWERVA
jgi:arsenite-transporting ATPase